MVTASTAAKQIWLSFYPLEETNVLSAKDASITTGRSITNL
jgi:hypothetical protein